jgi:hypothetical protein
VKRSEFSIGQEFWCGEKRWRCTDVGTRMIAAICIEPHEIVSMAPSRHPGTPWREARSITDDPSWHTGSPYAVEECVFDEFDMPGCSTSAEVEASGPNLSSRR